MFQRVLLVAISFSLLNYNSHGQGLTLRLNTALQKLSGDEQFKHAIMSLYIIDGKSGKTVFDLNSQVGLAPASCQKVITSASAFELLGKEYRYKTYIDYDGKADKGILKGNLYLSGRGDPTLGSERWNSTLTSVVLKKILTVLHKNDIQTIAGSVICDDRHFTNEPLPNGWIWEDIGNYYGAGVWGVNWMENQYDITFKTGNNIDDATAILSTKPSLIMEDYSFENLVKTGSKTSGDHGFLFSAPYQKKIIARGTVPMAGNGFTISGSMPDPPAIFIKNLQDYLKDNGIHISAEGQSHLDGQLTNGDNTMQHLDSILSPSLDSINYWLLKKSVNLYGEAFVKAIGFEKTNSGSTDTGTAIIREFWSRHGIKQSALKIIDGSGLSPANRITTHSLVTVLQYAKGRPWFLSFYNSVPEINGIKMKDGYISGVRSYTGFLKDKSGKEFIFAFIINNFDGNPGTVRDKMWRILSIINN